MHTDPQYPTHLEDEISLREVILKIQGFIKELFKYFWIPVILALLGGAYMYYQYTTQVTNYTGKLTFMVDSNEGGGLSGMATILATFGLGSGGKRANLDKITQIGKSRKIIYRILQSKTQIDGKEDFFANHLLNIYPFREMWKKADRMDLADFVFTQKNIQEKNPAKDAILNTLYKKIVGSAESENQLLNSGYDDDSGIMFLAITSESEDFSINFTDSLFDVMSRYYIEKSSAKALKTYKVFKAKADSIYKVLTGKQYALANIFDQDKTFYLRTSKIKRDRLLGEIEIFTRAYAEAYKNMEVAAFDLDLKTPYITVIDRPIAPLPKKSPNLLMDLIKGLLLGGIIGSAFVILRKIYRDVMTEPLQS